MISYYAFTIVARSQYLLIYTGNVPGIGIIQRVEGMFFMRVIFFTVSRVLLPLNVIT